MEIVQSAGLAAPKLTSENFADVIVIGGGASGFFGAITSKERKPEQSVLILEKSTRLLSKVKVSGGGRCNVTHNCFNPFRLAAHYPRGERALKELFKRFQASDMVEWLNIRGVELKSEDDGRMFPITDDSQTIIDTFIRSAQTLGVRIRLNTEVVSIHTENGLFRIACRGGDVLWCRRVLVCAGGSPKIDAYNYLRHAGHNVISPIPSLFTLNDPSKEFSDLMGVSVGSGEIRITGTNYSQRGPLLITHWGLSGPAVIKLSAWAASYLHQENYSVDVLVNWTDLTKEDDVKKELHSAKLNRPKQRVLKSCPFQLPGRLWEKLCSRAGVEEDRIWGELPGKLQNRLLENLFRCKFSIKGKTTFKEEFVTCGGVDLKEVDLQTMQSKIVPGLYFAGEVLNIDGETGGFNFQAAWTTAFVAGNAIAEAL